MAHSAQSLRGQLRRLRRRTSKLPGTNYASRNCEFELELLRILQQTNQIHLRLVHWFVQTLIRLAPDQEEISDEARYSIYSSTDSVERLIEVSGELKDVMLHFTTSLVS